MNVSPWGFPARAGPAGSGHQRPEQKFEVSAGHFHCVVSTRVIRLLKIEMRVSVWDVHSSRQDGNLRSVLTDTTLTVTVRETDESYTQVLARYDGLKRYITCDKHCDKHPRVKRAQ